MKYDKTRVVLERMFLKRKLFAKKFINLSLAYTFESCLTFTVVDNIDESVSDYNYFLMFMISSR